MPTQPPSLHCYPSSLPYNHDHQMLTSGDFEDPCYGCESLWCMYNDNRAELRAMLLDLSNNKRMSNKQKRHRCHRDAVSLKWGYLGHALRKRVGWCWENKCRVKFPDSFGSYIGFKERTRTESEEYFTKKKYVVSCWVCVMSVIFL